MAAAGSGRSLAPAFADQQEIFEGLGQAGCQSCSRTSIRRLVRAGDGRLVGMISRYDVLRALEELW